MQQLLIQSLHNKFNPDIYYTLAISEIIDYTMELDKFKELCVPPLNKKEGPVHPFMKGEAVLYRLSGLLNIYFKNGLSNREVFYKKFEGFSD